MEVKMLKKCTPLWREAHLEVKRYNQCQSTFGSREAEKVHAVVARSTFGSENVNYTTDSDHFLTIRWQFDVEKVHALVA